MFVSIITVFLSKKSLRLFANKIAVFSGHWLRGNQECDGARAGSDWSDSPTPTSSCESCHLKRSRRPHHSLITAYPQPSWFPGLQRWGFNHHRINIMQYSFYQCRLCSLNSIRVKQLLIYSRYEYLWEMLFINSTWFEIKRLSCSSIGSRNVNNRYWTNGMKQ